MGSMEAAVRSRARTLGLTLLCLFILSAVAALFGPPAAAQYTALDIFDGVWNFVAEHFAGTYRVDWEEAAAIYRDTAAGAQTVDELYEILREMVALIGDDGTFIRTPREVEEALARDNSRIIGVGVILSSTPQGDVYVLSVLTGGPAYLAGVRQGERVVAVDGVPMAGKSTAEVASAIRGEEGTEVELTLAGPDDSVRTVTISRAPVTVTQDFEARVLPGGIGYIEVPTLRSGAEYEVLAALRRMYSTDGLILDLRSFDGVADADAVLRIAGLFTQARLGAIVTRHDAAVLEPTRDWGRSGPPGVPPPTGLDYYQRPVAIIVQDAAAVSPYSLALVAGLQEAGRAILVGRGAAPDLNLGGGQVIVQLPGGAILSVTSSYLVSLRTQSFVTRFEPDVPVAVDRSYLAKWYRGEDPDVEAAIEALARLGARRE